MGSGKSNVVVAVTVLAALAALGWMIVQFGGTLGGLAAGSGYDVRLSLPRVDGLSEGARVTYRGQSVGRVASIAPDESRIAFDVVLMLQDDFVPSNVEGVVKSTNPISGGAAIELTLQGDMASGKLSDGPEMIPGRSPTGGLIPEELPALAEEIRGLVAEMREQNLPATIREQAERLGELVESVNAVAGDGEFRDNLKETVVNTRRATEEAALAAEEYRKLGERANLLGDQAESVLADASEITGDAKAAAASVRTLVDDTRGTVKTLSDDAVARMRQADALLARFNAIAAKVDQGEGTMAMLLNDPQAYQALRDDLLILGRVLKAAERLVEQVESEGVKVSIF